MKVFIAVIIYVTSITVIGATVPTKRSPSPSVANYTITECNVTTDCDRDSDCLPGLLCADQHKAGLRALGLDERGAYCTNLTNKPKDWEVCYDPKKIVPPPVANYSITECNFTIDCDIDTDCIQGLLCADKHKPELKALGLDDRGAYCSNIGNKPKDWEVCYDPKKLAPTTTLAPVGSPSSPVSSPVTNVGITECNFTIDCDRDTECVPGLLCADQHKAGLKALGLDERGAYCANLTKKPRDLEVCYNPKKIILPPVSNYSITECNATVDCDLDTDCIPGLLCADMHKAELRALKLDERGAYCSNLRSKPKDWEVCYDPKKIAGPKPTPAPISMPTIPVPPPTANFSITECNITIDCDRDTECLPGLLCADQHKPELKALGLDERNAYCTNVTSKPKDWELCYDPKKIVALPPAANYSITECNFTADCDRDTECLPGLLCADQHKAELKSLGLDERGAYCSNLVKKPRYLEVCYDPKKIVPPNASNYSITECNFTIDCDLDTECLPGLLCADKHKAELKALGLDERGAYCSNLEKKPKDWEVCYDPKKLASRPTPAPIRKPTSPVSPPMVIYNITECNFTVDCDRDIECVSGLLCADEHKGGLKALGLDERGAYCTNLTSKPKDWEVCYDPKKISYPPVTNYSITECNITVDCDFDSDCLPGLLCADQHEKELKALGLNERSAYCTNVTLKPSDWELCYDPKKIGTKP